VREEKREERGERREQRREERGKIKGERRGQRLDRRSALLSSVLLVTMRWGTGAKGSWKLRGGGRGEREEVSGDGKRVEGKAMDICTKREGGESREKCEQRRESRALKE
jgi:hypothetical protein